MNVSNTQPINSKVYSKAGNIHIGGIAELDSSQNCNDELQTWFKCQMNKCLSGVFRMVIQCFYNEDNR